MPISRSPISDVTVARSSSFCRLTEWATQPKFVYTHQWTIGDLLIWDNTGTMHQVTHYDIDSGRLLSRTTLDAEEALV